MTLDLVAIRALAAKATQPSPWRAIDDGHGRWLVVDANEMWVADVGQAPDDAAFIAATSPVVVIALLDKVERLESILHGREHEAMRRETIHVRGELEATIRQLRGDLDLANADAQLQRDKLGASDLLIASAQERAETAEATLKAPEVHWECRQRIDALEEKLAAMTAARDEACQIVENSVELSRPSSKRRIAELRNVGITEAGRAALAETR